MTLLVAAALMAAVVGFLVIHPILARRSALVRDITSSGALDAEARKRVALTELKELEYDFLGGKLDATDYQALRERVSREALAAIRVADTARGAAGAAPAAGEELAAAASAHVCGFVNPPHSRFCSGCGVRLA